MATLSMKNRTSVIFVVILVGAFALAAAGLSPGANSKQNKEKPFIAYGFVGDDGTLDASKSVNIDGMVSPTRSYYCFNLSFAPNNVQLTNVQDQAGNLNSGNLGELNAAQTASLCPSGYRSAAVVVAPNGPFYVLFVR